MTSKGRAKKTGELASVEILFNVKKNQIGMMKKRKYVIDDEDNLILKMDIEDFLKYVKEKTKDMTISDPVHSLNKLYTKFLEDGTQEKNYVYYISPNKSGKKICTSQIIELSLFIITLEDVRKVDIISSIDFHTLSIEALKRTLKTKMFTIWLYKELVYDIFASPWVPKYKVLSKEEVKNIFFDENDQPLIKKKNLPYLRIDDPAAKILNLNTGDIVQYKTKNPFVNSLVSSMIEYRQVVSSSIYSIKDGNN